MDDGNHQVSENDDMIFSHNDIKKFKVDGLKKELCFYGLSHIGKKTELVERLQKAMDDKVLILNIH